MLHYAFDAENLLTTFIIAVPILLGIMLYLGKEDTILFAYLSASLLAAGAVLGIIIYLAGM